MKIAEMKMGRQLDDQRRTGESDLNGTIGQADAGTLHGGSYTLSSGFPGRHEFAVDDELSGVLAADPALSISTRFTTDLSNINLFARREK